MGRMNRSRKRKDAMNRVKRERNEKKELARLKKVLGIVDDEGMDLKDQVADITEFKTAGQIKRVSYEIFFWLQFYLKYPLCTQEKREKEEAEIEIELKERDDKGEDIEVVNEKTNVVHVYNTKTGRDQFGNLPAWKQPRRTERKIRKVNHSRKLNFNQAWCAQFIPLDWANVWAECAIKLRFLYKKIQPKYYENKTGMVLWKHIVVFNSFFF